MDKTDSNSIRQAKIRAEIDRLYTRRNRLIALYYVLRNRMGAKGGPSNMEEAKRWLKLRGVS